MTDNYFKLKSPFTSLDAVKAYALSEEKHWDSVFNLGVIGVPNWLIADISILRLMKEFDTQLLSLRFKGNYWHKWHSDAYRDVALNVVIQSSNSHTLFGIEQDGHYTNLDELVYADCGMYLLNTANKHSILNLGDDRYILSLGFSRPTTFFEVRDFCLEHNL